MAMAAAMASSVACCSSSAAASSSPSRKVSRIMDQVRSRGFSSVKSLRIDKNPEPVRKQKWQILSMDKDDYLAKKARDRQAIEDSMPDFDELDKDELFEFLDIELESSMDFSTNKHYEIMFLVHEKNVDEVPAVIEKVREFIKENKGVVHRLNNWGMRNLAYKIKKASRANYLLMNIELNSQAINDLNTLFEKDERVIRHMVMSQKVAITKEHAAPEEYRPSKEAENEEKMEEEEEDEEEEEEEEEESELVFQRQ